MWLKTSSCLCCTYSLCGLKCLSGGLFRSFCSFSLVLFGPFYTLQVWMVTVFLHCWQRTEQHQENLQEQRCTTSARPALYPGPQHTSSHPSGASRDVPGSVSKDGDISFYIVIDNWTVISWWHALTGLTITSPTSSPWDAIIRVEMTEIWGGCKIQKVSGSRGFDVGVTGEQSCPWSNTS